MPQKTWVVGEEVLATDFNTYVQNQVVPRFATVAARDAAWPAATAGDGAVSITTDTGTMWTVAGLVWIPGANVAPRGRVASNIVTAAQAGFGTTPTAIATTVTYVFDANRWVEICASVPLAIGATATVGSVVLLQSSNAIAANALALPGNGGTGYAHLRWQGKMPAGSKVITLTVAANTGTINHAASATVPSIISIVDLGV